ncbi:undecaprenyl-diphosphatase [Murinocardiopsis flavida]|uniref:Undecaprenyl-diphosphatase n=2 Tax=Murinocardiopsis flavida TaxID=645275 RepID=A0A2P8DDW6_9ACTN|nr:undecaprenyl-diphosphatase [Murinocardiopsis flavida]
MWPSWGEIAWGMASDKSAIFMLVALIVMTVLSAGPLHIVDNWVNTAPRPFYDEIRMFLILWPDTIASRGVAGPVLGVVALHFAYQYQSWRPIILSGAGLVGMIGLVGTMKFLLTRGHPRTFNPAFFSDGGGVSFPSGHGANAILIYGIALFLIIRYKAVRPHIVHRLAWTIVVIAILQSMISTYLHFHWFSDLATGMVAGGFALRLVIRLDQMIPEGYTTHWWWPWRGRRLWSGEHRAAADTASA